MENINQETDITLEHSTPIEVEIQDHLNQFYHDQDKIEYRLFELENEMDLETYINVESTSLTLAGIILSLAVSKKWLILPLATSLLSLRNVVGGRKNPVALFRKLGFRTREEIEKEKYALKAIRGDFKYLLDVPNAVWNAVNR